MQALINGLANIACRGAATGGTKTTLIDTRKDISDDLFNDKIIKMNINNIDYYRKITDTSNNNTFTFATLPGAPAVAVWTISEGVTITITSATDGGNEYSLVAALAEEEAALSAELVGNVITVTLATDAEGVGINAANTVTLVTAAIDALDEFSAEASGEGSTVVSETTDPIEFENGVEEVKPTAGTAYEINWR